MIQQMGASDLDELVQQMEQSEDDPRRCYALVRERISHYRSQGTEIPADLARMEQMLRAECIEESQGR